MKKSTLISLSISVSIAVLAAGVAISAQDKYTVQVPNGLAFSEFRGYEDWPVIAVSLNGGKVAVITGNPAMMAAFREGVPDSGKAFPDGAKMAKIHWNPKTQDTYPGQPTVPGIQHDVDFMVKDSKRFADSGGWGWAVFNYDAASGTFTPGTEADKPPQANDAKCGSRATRSCRQKITFSRSTEKGDGSTGIVDPALVARLNPKVAGACSARTSSLGCQSRMRAAFAKTIVGADDRTEPLCPLLMLWTAPPPARECHAFVRIAILQYALNRLRLTMGRPFSPSPMISCVAPGGR